MVKSNILLLLILFVTAVMAQEKPAQGIKWMSFTDAVATQKADAAKYAVDKKANPPPKKIFMDVYTSWCGPCKKMDANTFPKPSVIKAMNKYYYAVKFNAEQPDDVVYNEHTFINPNPAPVKGRRGVHQLAASILDNQLFYPSFVILDENTNRLVIHKGYKGEMVMAGILAYYGSNEYIKLKEAVLKQDEQVRAKAATSKAK